MEGGTTPWPPSAFKTFVSKRAMVFKPQIRVCSSSSLANSATGSVLMRPSFAGKVLAFLAGVWSALTSSLSPSETLTDLLRLAPLDFGVAAASLVVLLVGEGLTFEAAIEAPRAPDAGVSRWGVMHFEPGMTYRTRSLACSNIELAT